MQFDAASGRAGFDPHAAATIQRQFMESGYNTPHIVFWNLRAAGRPIFQVWQAVWQAGVVWEPTFVCRCV